MSGDTKTADAAQQAVATQMADAGRRSSEGAAEGIAMSKQVGAKSMTATVRPVEHEEHPDGEFCLILSNDHLDRDKENLWADEWQHPLPDKIHMDSDHAWARGRSVPETVGSGVPSIDSDGNLVVKGVYADTDHAQMTRRLVNKGHIWQASVSYLEHENPDGGMMRELLNGTFTGVPNNTAAVVMSSKSMSDDTPEARSKTGGTTAGQYTAGDGPFGDPDNRKWPLNTRKRIINAWDRVHQSQATVNYSSTEVEEIKGRIRSAARREGILLSDDKAVTAVASFIHGVDGLVKMKDVLAPWALTQTAPAHTEAGEDVGAVSVYDETDGESNDTDGDNDEDDVNPEGGVEDADREGNVLEWGDIHQSLAQACHDMACTIRDAALALGAQAGPDLTTVEDDDDDWEEQGWGDKAVSVEIGGSPDAQQLRIRCGDEILATADLTNYINKSNPGRPTGPYQGVTGMSGENATDVNPGQPVDGQLFLGGTADPGKAESKSLPASTDNGTAAGDTEPPAAAPSPADVAARAKSLSAARVRAFSVSMTAIPESEEN